MILKCIAVDDEPLALGLISSFIKQTPFLELIGSFSSGIKALEAINSNQIDVVFLDIQMPDLTGIQLAKTLSNLSGEVKPRVIFTTAYSNFAIEGYKVDAIDYLLKPFDYAEFLNAASKAKAYTNLLHQQEVEAPNKDYIFLKVEYQLVKIALSDIIYIEGLKDYVKVHLKSNERAVLSLATLKSLEEKLPSSQFMRIHRSFIISLNEIETIHKNAVQIGNASITIGEQYKDAMKVFLDRWA